MKASADSVRLLRRAGVLACLEPVEVIEGVRGATEAMARGDAPAALDALDPDVEWHATVGGIDEGRHYHGREEVAAAFIDYFAVWERMELRVDDYIDAGGDEVVVLFCPSSLR